MDRDMDEEFRHHRESFVADLIASGVSPQDAQRRARLEFGGDERLKEECREAKGQSLLDEAARNLRFAARLLRRSPGYALTAIATLALCIGVNTAVFSVADGVLFRALPFAEPERLGQIVRQQTRRTVSQTIEQQDGFAWETLSVAKSFDLAASGNSSGVNLVRGGATAFVKQHRVGSGYFRVLGVPMMVGREFTPEEDRTGGPKAMVLSHALWQRLYRGDRSALGQTILLKGEPHSIVGIAPASFRPIVSADLWTPLRPSITGEGGGTNYTLIARLNPETNWPQAQAEAEGRGQAVIARQGLPADVTARVNILPLQDVSSARIAGQISVLWACVGVVLLIGCVNVAGLMLARGAARAHELGTRVALGGGAGAILRQIGMEALLLGLLGGLAGLGVAYVSLEALASISQRFGVWQELRLDGRVLVGTFALSMLTALLCGVAPAWQASRVDARSAMVEGGSRSVSGRRGHFFRRALVCAQVALCSMLLIGAGLLVRTLIHLRNLEPGFDVTNVAAASASLDDARYRDAARVNQLFRQTVERMRALPAVESAAAGLHVPYQRWLNAGVVAVNGPAAQRDRAMTTMTYVTAGYFQTLRIPILAGRRIDERDTEKSAPVVVVSETFARRILQGQEAVGSRVKLLMDSQEREVVGVAADVQGSTGFGGGVPLQPLPASYVPVTQLPSQNFELVHTWFSPSWIVRSRGATRGLRQQLQEALAASDPLLPISSFRELSEVRDAALSGQQFQVRLLGGLAGLALLLSCVGIYGLAANSVVERTKEMGIRMALGATVGRTVWAAAKPGIGLTSLGVLLGWALSLAAARVLKSVLYGVQPIDAATYVTVGVGLAAVGALASLLPSLRLARIDPAQTLRRE
jgi:predicted permease